jgi:hypothetical protein
MAGEIGVGELVEDDSPDGVQIQGLIDLLGHRALLLVSSASAA